MKSGKLLSAILAAAMCVCISVTGVAFFASADMSEKKYTIINPYDEIDWGVVMHAKSGLHVHTSNSGIVWDDGKLSKPDAVIKGYENAGFNALTITDHDYVTYPWSGNENMMPPRNVNTANSKLITMAGNELSKVANQLAYGVEYYDKYDPNNIKNQSDSNGFDQNIVNVGEAGGIVYFAHPRRNDPFETNRDKGETANYSDLWWLSKFTKYPAAKGLEVLNCGQFSKNHSERLWDSLLTKSMPSRIIYGTASDDNHGGTSYDPSTDLGTGFTNLLLMPNKKNGDGMVDALTYGKSYFSTYMMINNVNGANDDNKLRPSTPVPTIEDISVDNEQGTITVKTKFASKVEWISGYDGENAVSKIAKTDINAAGTSDKAFTATVNVESLKNLAGYIRIRIIGDGGQTHSQPFTLKKYYPTLTVAKENLGLNFTTEKLNYDSTKYNVSLSEQFNSVFASGSVLTPSQTIYAKAKTDIADQPTPIFSIILPSRPQPPVLTLSSRNETSIKLNKTEGTEYKLEDGAWQESNVFTGLSPSTAYTVYVRQKATADNFASETVSKEFFTKEGSATASGCGSSLGGIGFFVIFSVTLIFGIALSVCRKAKKLEKKP